MLRSILLCAAAMAIAAPAFAHHGPGTFELGKTVSFTAAKLTKIELLNPHGWLYFETTEPDGKVMKHRCEMRSAHVLRRSGWSPELFKSGEKVDITASPDRADVASCYLQTIVFANGSRMDRYGQYVKAPTGEVKEVRGPIKQANLNRPARRPSGEPNITGDWAPEQTVMANPRGVGGGMVRLSALPEQPPEVGQRQARAGGAAAPPAAARLGDAAPQDLEPLAAPRSPNVVKRRRPRSRRRTTPASGARPRASSSTGRLTAPSTGSRRTGTRSSSSTAR